MIYKEFPDMTDPKKDTKDREATKYYKQRIDHAQKKYEKTLEKFNERSVKNEEFLKRNDERLERIRKKTDENFEKHRAKVDKRLADNRKKINERYVKGDRKKEERLNQRIQKTDEYLAKKRKQADERKEKHRDRINQKREKNEELGNEFFLNCKLKMLRKLKLVEEDRKDVLAVKKFRVIVYVSVILFVIIIALEFWLPGSSLKRRGVIDDISEGEVVEGDEKDKKSIFSKKKQYYVMAESEQQLLWDLLYEHFDGNTTAVLGVMCNLKVESGFEASNLENLNNDMWGIEDDEYTEKVNSKSINKKDFLESRYLDNTNGYLNDYSQWVNRDGGYGYAQYTAYEEKQYLYAFAEDWFAEDGPGSEYKFNLADPQMQAHYIVHILESDRYKNMDAQIRNCTTVVDACYIWLKTYEVPYDPYNDNYFTLAFDRAATADEIMESCGRSGN